MELNLRDTPNILAISTNADPNEVIAKKFNEAQKEAFADKSVLDAGAKRDAAAKRVEDLKVALRVLNRHGAEISQFLDDAARVDPWIESAIKGIAPDAAELDLTSRKVAELNMVLRSIQAVAESRAPLANIALHYAQSEVHMKRAESLECIAHRRAEKLVEALKHAVAEEGAVMVDSRRGVSGLLMVLAAEETEKAKSERELADSLNEKYMSFSGGRK